MAKRTRSRPRVKPTPVPRDPHQEIVEDLASELLTLWRVMPSALPRDSAGLLTGDRHASGASNGSAASVNLDVVTNAVVIETGIARFEAEAVPILNLARAYRTTEAVIAALPDWHRALAARQMPLAKHLEKDLASWVRLAKLSIGLREYDRKLGSLCPDHRDERPTGLIIGGGEARLNAAAFGEQRGLVPAFIWERKGVIECRLCKRTWSTISERRLLAAELRALGDTRNEEIIR